MPIQFYRINAEKEIDVLRGIKNRRPMIIYCMYSPSTETKIIRASSGPNVEYFPTSSGVRMGIGVGIPPYQMSCNSELISKPSPFGSGRRGKRLAMQAQNKVNPTNLGQPCKKMKSNIRSKPVSAHGWVCLGNPTPNKRGPKKPAH